MKALVTGVAGLIGSHIADQLVDDGWTVYGVDDLSGGEFSYINKNVEVFINDFASETITSLIKKQNFNVVFHEAARPRVAYSVEHPAETNDHNVQRTLTLLESCVGNVGKVIFASSSSVYGGGAIPMYPSAAKTPRSPYALQKSVIEDYLAMFGDFHGLDSICLRYFNVFGPRARGNSPYATAIAAWLEAIYSGKHLRLDGDGTQRRDMCYVQNVVSANIKAAKANIPYSPAAKVYNVACGTNVSNLDILDRLKTKFNISDDQIDVCPPRLGDVKETLADIRRSFDDFGYVPEVDVWDGLDMTIEWWENNVGKRLKNGY